MCENTSRLSELLAIGDYTAIVALCEQATLENPTAYWPYWYAGIAFCLQGEPLAAASTWGELLAGADPETSLIVQDWRATLWQEASQHGQRQDWESATILLQSLLEWNPSDGEACQQLAIALFHLNRLEEALEAVQKAIQIQPNKATLWVNLGVILNQMGDQAGAIAAYQTALELESNNGFALNNLGDLYAAQNQLAIAQAYYQQAITQIPNNAVFHYNLGNVLQRQKDYSKAQLHYQQALALEPTNPQQRAYIAYNLGLIAEMQGQWQSALSSYEQALQSQPDYADARWNRCLMLLRLGRWSEAWPDYELRWRYRGGPRHFEQPQWDGTAPNGQRILLWAEQGYGDTLQFIRYASLVAQQGGQVIVECPDALVDVVATVAGISEVVVQGTPLPNFDFHCPLLSLPGLLATTPTTVPQQVPYLAVPSDRSLLHRRANRLQVALVWSSGAASQQARSVPLPQLLMALEHPTIDLHSLQTGTARTELAHLCPAMPDWGKDLQTFRDTAIVAQQFDLIITVDTAMAHLAGALGLPTWVLLACPSDWRWLVDRSDTPWYPTLRLFRQSSPGVWTTVLQDVRQQILRYLPFKLDPA